MVVITNATIIVLLILSGIVIASITGNNGILDKTKLAKDEYQTKENEENITLSKFENEVDKTKTDIASSRNDNTSSKFEETIIYKNENGATSGDITYLNNHTMSEFDALRLVYGYTNKNYGGIQTAIYGINDIKFAIKRTNYKSQIGIYGFDTRLIDIGSITETGFKITYSNLLELYFVYGIKY